MSGYCPFCGGVLGRDCFNVEECGAITRDMAARGMSSPTPPPEGPPTWKPTSVHPSDQRVVVVRWRDVEGFDLAYYGQEDEGDPYAWRQSVSNCLYVDGHDPHEWIDVEALAKFHLAVQSRPSPPEGFDDAAVAAAMWKDHPRRDVTMGLTSIEFWSEEELRQRLAFALDEVRKAGRAPAPPAPTDRELLLARAAWLEEVADRAARYGASRATPGAAEVRDTARLARMEIERFRTVLTRLRETIAEWRELGEELIPANSAAMIIAGDIGDPQHAQALKPVIPSPATPAPHPESTTTEGAIRWGCPRCGRYVRALCRPSRHNRLMLICRECAEAEDVVAAVQTDLHDGTICRHCGAPCGMRHGEACPESNARRDGSPA